MSTIVTLAVDAENCNRFNALRQKHYPRGLNQIAAHLTLFHTLPETEEVRAALLHEANALQPFTMCVTTVMSLGRGVAYALESSELTALHKRLSAALTPHLSAQDRQKFRPHIVVQNKTSGDEARLLREHLLADFAPWNVRAEGLEWWNYLGGPWELRERFSFG